MSLWKEIDPNHNVCVVAHMLLCAHLTNILTIKLANVMHSQVVYTPLSLKAHLHPHPHPLIQSIDRRLKLEDYPIVYL